MGFIGDAVGWVGDQLGITNPLNDHNINRGDFNLPGFQTQYDTFGRLAANTGGRRAPQSMGSSAAQSGFRGQQSALANLLMQQAQGRGPGQELVRRQAQSMADRGMAQQAGFAARANPQMAGLAGRNAAMAGAGIAGQAANAATMGGLQAQLGATDQLGGVLQGARGLDNQFNMFNAGQAQQNSQFNVDARLRQMGMNDARQLDLLRQRLAASQMQQQGGIAFQNARLGQATAAAQMPTFLDKALLGAAAMAPFAAGGAG